MPKIHQKGKKNPEIKREELIPLPFHFWFF